MVLRKRGAVPSCWVCSPQGAVPKEVEHLGASQARKRFGTTIEVVPETEDGDIDVAELERMIGSGPKPKLVAVSHIATNSGVQSMQPLWYAFYSCCKNVDCFANGAAPASPNVYFLRSRHPVVDNGSHADCASKMATCGCKTLLQGGCTMLQRWGGSRGGTASHSSWTPARAWAR